ncbi:hypothetical protein [Cerasicoccus frondis]|uniref:hypothetical protein n=1 Tax=Cerasicoccus frondis TaxID=490090 RepID=UPI002852A418|nr:hypothetical protein [Cerasicoccus frondis]
MRDAFQQEQVIERAKRDCEDIDALRKCEGLERYLLRRLREKQTAIAQEILADEELTASEREAKRQVWLEYSKLLVMIDRDFDAALKLLEQK